MTEAEALVLIRGFAMANRVTVTAHAHKRMRERGVSGRDLYRALTNASRCRAQADGSWRSSGPDTQGDDLTVVLVIEDGLIVITLF